MTRSDQQRLRALQAELEALAPSAAARPGGTPPGLADAVAEAAEPVRAQLQDAARRARSATHDWVETAREGYHSARVRLMSVPWSTIGGILASGGVVGLALYAIPVPRRTVPEPTAADTLRETASHAQASSQRAMQAAVEELRDSLAAVAAASSVLSRRARRRLQHATEAARHATAPVAASVAALPRETRRQAQGRLRRLSDAAAASRLADLQSIRKEARRCPVPFVHRLARKT